MLLPDTFDCKRCQRTVLLPDRPDTIPTCPACGQVMRAAWERDHTVDPPAEVLELADRMRQSRPGCVGVSHQYE